MERRIKINSIYEKIFVVLIKLFSIISILILGFVILFIMKESLVIFKNTNFLKFIFTKGWRPTIPPIKMGILPMILSTLYVSLIAIIISLPIGVGAAIFLNIILGKRTRRIVRPCIDLMAGIPSVLYGFWGLLVIVKFLEVKLLFNTGESVLAAGILLAIMALPYIIAACDESMEKIIKNYNNASVSLGVSKWHMIRYLVLPSSSKAIFAAFILGLSRSLGETMAAMMVIGNSPIYPKLFGQAETIPGLIALEMGGAQVGSMHYHGLFAAGFVLLLMLMIINILFYYIRKRVAYF